MFDPTRNLADARFHYPNSLTSRNIVITKEAAAALRAGAAATMHEPTCSPTNAGGLYPTAHAGKTLVLTEATSAALLAALNSAEPPDRPAAAAYADGIANAPIFQYALGYRWGDQ